MASEPEHYLAILKASYDYEPQPDAEEEIAIKEDQLLFLLERTDEDWWKVKVKGESQDEDSPVGLVPSAYVEPASHVSLVKALYDYEAQQDGELSVHEDEVLLVYDKDEDWLLVQSQTEETRIGYVPGNYVEETTGDNDSNEAPDGASPPALDLSKLVIPDSPPKPAYTDPAELVNRSKAKAQANSVETWSVSEVDKKGKKKKGTLGIGGGNMFFASESDKTPVQKWQLSDIQSYRQEKNKHVHVDIGGSTAISLHFHAGSKDVADAIISKLETSRSPPPELETEAESALPEPEAIPERPRSSAAKSVHFDASEPEIIPPREDDVEAEYDDVPQEAQHDDDDIGEGERAVVLYDFTADGDDEMSVHEGETLLVLERDTDEWWKCKNARGDEGVVPANYLELVPGPGGPQASVAAHEQEEAAAARAAREAAEQAEVERRAREDAELQEKERKKEAEQRAKAAAAVADADRRRREQERERQKEKEKEREKERVATEELQKQKAAQKQRESSIDGGSRSKDRKSNGDSSSARSSVDKRTPAPENTRVWHDRTGQFRVEAAFLGYAHGKLRLHKSNGVVIEVPSEKMSPEDMRYVEKMLKKAQGPSSPRRTSDDDEPLELRRKSLQPQPRTSQGPPKKGPAIDWFEFFLNAGCDIDDCTRYAQSFERDKIDEAILPDITESTMRSLGLREGDIIRVKKAIELRTQKSGSPANDGKSDQLRRDEELARQLQAEETGGSARGQPPNLFAGPNGALKNNVRRGRPQPSKSLPPTSVDIQSISSASDQIQRVSTPLVNSPARTGGTPTPVQPPARSDSAIPAATSGFDDDAWTNRPSSTKPIAPSSPANTRAASVPPAPPPPPAPVAPAAPLAPPAPPASAPPTNPAPAPVQQPAPTGLANKTESDIFEQLSRLRELRTQSPAVRPANITPSIVSPPPLGFQSGLGMGSSPSPMGQHLQAQQTGFLQPQSTPRGPLAPIPANQTLLQPLISTTTGFNNFVPTRPQSAVSPFQSAPSPSFLNTQPTGYPGASQPLLSQPTGFQPPQQQVMSQPTGFQPQQAQFQPQQAQFQPQPLMSQPTGLPGSGFGGQLNSFQGNTNFAPLQPNPTGFNPSFGQFNAAPPAPPPPQPSNDTNPANVFAQMKSGTFGNNNTLAPQPADKYNALRPNPPMLNPQTTGWGGGYQGGYSNGYGFQ